MPAIFLSDDQIHRLVCMIDEEMNDASEQGGTLALMGIASPHKDIACDIELLELKQALTGQAPAADDAGSGLKEDEPGMQP